MAWWINITEKSNQITEDQIYQITLILWNIWKQRNEKVFNTKDPDPLAVIRTASKHNIDYMTANSSLSCVNHVGNSATKLKQWSNPPTGYLKINLDGSFTNSFTEAGIGIACRDSEGSFKWAFIDKVKSISAFMTEALALKRALLLALDLSYDKVVFETDCLLLKRNIDKGGVEICEWQCRSIIHEILKLLASQVGFSICFTLREGNRVADHLAARAYKEVYPTGWVYTPSPLLSQFLALDVKKLNEVRESCLHHLPSVVHDTSGVLLPSSPSMHCSGIG